MDTNIEAEDHSVAASKIIDSIITLGNNSPVFVGRYERLRDAIIQPLKVFRRVQIKSFVGRRWLIEQIDSILKDNSCGYMMLEAQAGLGKTAFLAWLVKERNYINHFVELSPGQEGIERGLKNLAAQLIIAYNLSTEGVLPEAASRPDYLYELLTRAAEKLSPDDKIVIVVDALDEAGTPPHQNVLGLPEVLPEGVFFIVSMRPVPVMLQVDSAITPCWPLKILADSKENLQDLHSFLKASAAWPKVAKALEESKHTVEEFIDTLMEKSQGLWIYLHFIISDIEHSDRYQLDLDALPKGLPKYYASYWSRWRKEEEWYDLYLPILTSLAAEQEASSLDRILKWAEIGAQGGERSRLRSILKEQWRPFLAFSGEGKMEMYQFYHATVREFFEGKVEQESLLIPERDLVNELAEATADRHRMIAERYLAAWGGLEKGLPDLENQKDKDDGYGLRHLAAHLEASGQSGMLHCLLNLETGHGRNLWYRARGNTSGYINDIMRAWRLAEDSYDPKDYKRTGRLIGLQNRYALICSSINSLSGSIPSKLLLDLVENGIWSKEEGLAHARHIPDLYRRSIILTTLSSLLKEPKFLDEALTAARDINDESEYSCALEEIVPKFQNAQEALTLAQDIKNKNIRARTLAKIAPKLHEDQKKEVLEEALATAREIEDEEERANALAEIALRLQEDRKEEVLDEALAVARESRSASVLANIAVELQEGKKKEVLDEALAVAREIEDEVFRAISLANIAPRLQEDQKIKVLDEALAVARKIEDEMLRVYALDEITPKFRDVRDVLAVAREIKDERWRSRALAEIAPRHPDVQEALALARESRSASALAEIALRLQELQKKEVMEEALAAAPEINDKWKRTIALAEIATRLQEDQEKQLLEEALATAREIMDEKERVNALVNIAPRLQEKQKQEVMEEALATAREIKDEKERASAFAEIAPKFMNIQEALAVAWEIELDFLRDDVMAEIALKFQNIQETLVVAREIENGFLRANVMAEIAPRFMNIQETLAVIRELKNEWWHGNVVAETQFQEDQENVVLEDSLVTGREIENEKANASTLTEIVPQFQEDQKHEALTEVLAGINGIDMTYELMRIRALAEIAPKIQDNQKNEVLEEALAAAREIKDEWWRARAIVEIAPTLHEDEKNEVLKEELASARKSRNPIVLAEIAPRLLEDQKNAVLEEALAIAREIQDEEIQAIVLAEIAPRLPDVQEALAVARESRSDSALAEIAPKIQDVREALATAREIQNEEQRAIALTAIAPRLQYAKKVLAVVREIEDKELRDSALVEISSKIQDVQEALAVAREIRDEEQRASALAGTILRLLDQQTLDDFSLWKPTIHSLSNRTRPDLLSDLPSLLPLVDKLGGDDALLETARAIKDVGRWWA